MRFLAVIAAVVGIVGGAAACATGHSGGPGSEMAYPDVQSFCQAWGQAECSSAVVSACGAKSASSCVSARAASCIKSQPQGTTYVAANAAACIDLARMAYATSTLSASQLAQMTTVCGTQVFSGPGAVRSPCTADADCSSLEQLSCVIPYGEMSGKCLTPTPVPPNGSCVDEAAVCGDGWFCDPKMKLCTVDAASGESCQDGWRPCSQGLTCTGGLFATCAQKFDDGHPCTLDGDCTGGLCDKASTMGEGTCASQITLTPLDQACAPFTGQ